MQETLLKSLLITAIITFTLSVIHNNENIYDEYFLYKWLKSWCIAYTISLVFNIFLFPRCKLIRRKQHEGKH
ncbi:DUF2798 domain-containing protein [Chryseobacterium piperi]|uniref:DUF2798 domain-containing protein n=1 Tax=Chryseobacterium piperi TaxID=558152 RepID=UPI0009FE4C54|nr:DUF2798 domain-containing protein [Chryseobacterium piperi]